MPTPFTGGCLCGAIRYTLDAEVKELRACHCTHCQKAGGAGGSVYAVVPSSALTFTEGTPKRHEAKADSGRMLYRFFCADCGSPIYAHRDTMPELWGLRVGSLDDSGELKITAHSWTRSARSWDHIDPGTKQFPRQSDSPPVT